MLAWCLKGERVFIVRRVVMIFFGLLFISPMSFFIYSSESFRSLVFSFAPLINGLIFAFIAIVFIRALIKFRRIYLLSKIKVILIYAISLLIFLITSLYSVGGISVENPHGILILLDLALLGILPILTSPFSIEKNRVR